MLIALFWNMHGNDEHINSGFYICCMKPWKQVSLCILRTSTLIAFEMRCWNHISDKHIRIYLLFIPCLKTKRVPPETKRFLKKFWQLQFLEEFFFNLDDLFGCQNIASGFERYGHIMILPQKLTTFRVVNPQLSMEKRDGRLHLSMKGPMPSLLGQDFGDSSARKWHFEAVFWGLTGLRSIDSNCFATFRYSKASKNNRRVERSLVLVWNYSFFLGGIDFSETLVRSQMFISIFKLRAESGRTLIAARWLDIIWPMFSSISVRWDTLGLWIWFYPKNRRTVQETLDSFLSGKMFRTNIYI